MGGTLVTEEEFVAVVERQRAMYISGMQRMVGNDAEDIVQSGLLKAYRALGTFQGRSQLSTWIYRIIAVEALLWIRYQRAECRDIKKEAPNTLLDDDGRYFYCDRVDVAQTQPSHEWLGEWIDVERALADIPEQHKALVAKWLQEGSQQYKAVKAIKLAMNGANGVSKKATGGNGSHGPR